ncbi:MAG: hypothetical protein IJ481_00560 [Alphaproteobacteria bacterium]|nr:hypothetical protein [Alphaproteobacteria bacterium]
MAFFKNLVVVLYCATQIFSCDYEDYYDCDDESTLQTTANNPELRDISFSQERENILLNTTADIAGYSKTGGWNDIYILMFENIENALRLGKIDTQDQYYSIFTFYHDFLDLYIQIKHGDQLHADTLANTKHFFQSTDNLIKLFDDVKIKKQDYEKKNPQQMVLSIAKMALDKCDSDQQEKTIMLNIFNTISADKITTLEQYESIFNFFYDHYNNLYQNRYDKDGYITKIDTKTYVDFTKWNQNSKDIISRLFYNRKSIVSELFYKLYNLIKDVKDRNWLVKTAVNRAIKNGASMSNYKNGLIVIQQTFKNDACNSAKMLKQLIAFSKACSDTIEDQKVIEGKLVFGEFGVSGYKTDPVLRSFVQKCFDGDRRRFNAVLKYVREKIQEYQKIKKQH